MEEPNLYPTFWRKFGMAIAWVVLIIAIPFALSMAYLPCGYQEIGAANSYLKEMAPIRVPQMLWGAIACCAALVALCFLATAQQTQEAGTKTKVGCSAGCLILLLLLLLMFLSGYSSG